MPCIFSPFNALLRKRKYEVNKISELNLHVSIFCIFLVIFLKLFHLHMDFLGVRQVFQGMVRYSGDPIVQGSIIS